LVNVGIQAAIEERLAELKVGADEVLTRLAEHARGSMADFLEIRGNWVKLDVERASQAGVLHLIKKFRQTKQGTEVELYSAQEALALLGKHHGLFLDKLALTDPSGEREYAGLTDEQRVARIAELLDAARVRRDGQAAGSGGGGEGSE